MPIAADASGIFFSFDNDTKVLTAYETVTLLYQNVDLKRSLNGSYLFFDSAGSPLHIAALNNGDPLRYALWTSPNRKNSSLKDILGMAKAFKGPADLASEQQILAFLQRHKDV